MNTGKWPRATGCADGDAGTRSGFLALLCCLVVAACTGAPDVAEPANEVAWVKKVNVHGVPIYATNTTGDDKLLHAAGVLAQFLDNDEDGEIDNPKVHQAMLDTAGTIVMTGTQDEAHEMDWANAPRGQGLYDEETEIDARAVACSTSLSRRSGTWSRTMATAWPTPTCSGRRRVRP